MVKRVCFPRFSSKIYKNLFYLLAILVLISSVSLIPKAAASLTIPPPTPQPITPGGGKIALSPTGSSILYATAENYYLQSITASGGTAPYFFSEQGTLPPGLSFMNGSPYRSPIYPQPPNTCGSLFGTTTSTGTFYFMVSATDVNGNSGAQNYTLTVNAPTITFSPASLSPGISGSSYSVSLTASGGASPYTYSISSGAPPSSLGLSNSDPGQSDNECVVSGTISAAAGTYSFTIQAKDAGNYAGSQSYTLNVYNPISITTASLPGGDAGTAYSTTLAATGGSGSYTWTYDSLPSWLSISSAGVLYGETPSSPIGSPFSVTVTATDTNDSGNYVTKSFSLTVIDITGGHGGGNNLIYRTALPGLHIVSSSAAVVVMRLTASLSRVEARPLTIPWLRMDN